MKILAVTQYFYPENFKINDLVIQMQKRGHDVTVLTGLPNYPEGRFYSGYGFWGKRTEDYYGAKVIRSLLIPRGKGGGVRLLINYLSFVVFASFAAIFRLRDKYDVVFVCQLSPITIAIPALVVKRLKSTPVIMWVQDLWPESVSDAGNIHSKLVLKALNSLVQKIYDGCDKLLLSSRGFRKSIKLFKVPDSKISFLPNWAEDLFKPDVNSEEFEYDGILPEGFRVMFAGNIGEAQDFSSVINAAEKLRDWPDIKWIIIGDGRNKEWASKEVESRKLTETVMFLGRYDMKTMPAFFSRADVMLMTLKKSKIFSRTIPSKLQTYMACGRPILTMVDGEGSSIVEEAGAGLTCGSGESDKLAGNVLKMYNMTLAKRDEFGNNALKYYNEHYSRDVLLDKLEIVMQELIDDHRKK